MYNFSSTDSVTITGLKELRAQGVVSSRSYTAKLVGWSDEEAAVSTFDSLVDAIHWLTEAVENGALAKQAIVYSAKNEVIWSLAGFPREQLREIAMKRNAQRILAQSNLAQEHWLELLGDDIPMVPD